MDWFKQVTSNPVGLLAQVIANRTISKLLPTATREESRDNLDENDIEGNLSKMAYRKDYDQVDRALSKYNYKVDRDLSNDNATVYINQNTGEPTIAYRGTELSNPDDLLADLHIAVGSRNHKRFRDAEELAVRTQNKYENKKVKVTGHSLGGTQALHVNERLGHEARVYQPGASILGTDRVRNHNVEVVRHEKDIVSSGLQKGREKRITLNGNRGIDPTRNHNIF
jgi:hypothetical protein